MNHAPWVIAAGFAVAAHFGWFCPGHSNHAKRGAAAVADAGDVTSARELPLASEIERVSETHVVPLALAEKVMDDPTLLTDSGRITVARRHGNAAGLKISHTRRGGLLRLLGLRNGDVIKSIAGRPVRSLGDVEEVLSNLCRADNIRIVIRRDGVKIRKRYRFE